MLVRLARPVASLLLTAALIALVLLALGASPLLVFGALWEGAFGNWLAATDTLVKATPLVFTGLAVSIAFRGALWNIGAEGQLLVGALAAAALGIALDGWPRPLAVALVLAGGALGGALWSAVCGWLRERRDVSEVISTIMLNFVAAQLLSYAVHGPLMEPSRSYPKSAPIARAAELWTFAPPSRLNAGMILAVALALASWLWLFHSRSGFELRAMGRNRRVAAFFGIPVARLGVAALALSGALAGLGGAVQVSAITHRLYESFSPGWGYEAIAVALVARLNPLGVILTSLLFGALDNGSQAMQRSQGVSPELVQVIQGVAILILLAFDTETWARLNDALWPPGGSDAARATAPGAVAAAGGGGDA
ncbi:MAG TPA: ABC transporter permease [Candidatus Binataceae bacterium]|jgi:simple sugar transport system permease protein